MIDEETGLLKGWDAVEGLDGTKRYYPKGKENNLDFELSEEEYLKEVEKRSTKITNIPQSKDDPLGTKLTKQVTAAAHNFAIDRPGITGVLSGAANFMSGVTEDLKRSATNPNEKDIGKRLIGSFIHIEDAVIDKSATGARMWATGSDLYNPFTKEKIGSLPDLNVDPTLATVVGGVSAGIVTGAFTDKGLNKVSKFKIPPNNLQPALVTNNTVLGQSVNTVLKNEDLVKTSFQYTRQPRTQEVKNLIKQSLPSKPTNVGTAKWGNYIEKFGNTKAALQAADIEKEAIKFWKKQQALSPDGKGSLKSFGTLREIDGKMYYIKNKANSLKEPNFNFDSLEKTTLGRVIRESTATVDEKLVKDAAKRINANRTKLGTELLTETQITDYIKAQKRNKNLLKRLIRNLNYDEGLRTWSLGHIEAVKSHIKKGKKGADMITNLELEPFRDMFDAKTGRWIQGNASRSNKDELTDIILQAINKSETIDEDIVKFTEPILRDYWPRKGPVSDKTSWLKEHYGQKKYIELVEKYGVDEVYEILAGSLPVSKAPTTTVLSN